MDARARLSRFIEDNEDAVAALARGGTPDAGPPPRLRAVGVGWATVELDRAAAELTADLDLEAGAFAAAPNDFALGAYCRVATVVLDTGREPLAVVLLEPSTEGRLAGTLARHGEGPVALWLAADDLAAAAGNSHAAGATLSAERDGPFGPERLFLDGPIHGPHRFLVAGGPGTIAT